MGAKVGDGSTLTDIATAPGWADFLLLTRTVNFLRLRRCRAQGYEHVGVHKHNGMFVYNSMTRENGEYNADMLEHMMEESLDQSKDIDDVMDGIANQLDDAALEYYDDIMERTGDQLDEYMS